MVFFCNFAVMKILIDDKIREYTSEQIAQWLDELPKWRREQALAYKHDMGRRQSLLAYRLLCQGLREEYGITEQPTFEYGEHGKPSVSLYPPSSGDLPQQQTEHSNLMGGGGGGLHFSLSHCREAVACVIDDKPCGIDIECTERRVTDSLIHYSMNEEEQTSILRLPVGEGRETVFLRLWTQKEAVLKLMGTGIRDTMKDVLINCPYNIETKETDRWIMSVATSRNHLPSPIAEGRLNG